MKVTMFVDGLPWVDPEMDDDNKRGSRRRTGE
jgi:hypothetical protein